MPNYDYECLECGKRFEVFQSMKDEKLTDCPLEDCAGKVKRLLGTGGGIIFKGSGFYLTDYRSSSYEKGAKADKPPEKSEPKADTKKSETKPTATKPAVP
jgi:putative FmdB family regulatory protein